MRTPVPLRMWIVILILVVSSSVTVHRVSGGIYSSNCMPLDIPGGRYYLTGQLSGAPLITGLGFNACLWIKADGIVLHLYDLTMTGPGDQVGILNTANKVTIEDSGIITNYRIGILLATGSGNIVNGVTLTSNTQAGIMVGYCCPAALGSDGDLVRGSSISSNGNNGVILANSHNSQLIGNTITGTFGNGVTLVNSMGSQINRNLITNNAVGVYADASSGFSQIYWNQLSFNSQFGIVALSSSNSIDDDNVSNTDLHGISVAGDSNQIGHDTVYRSGGRGIGLGGVCLGGIVYSAGNNNSIVSDTAIANTADFFWDGAGAGNVWLHDTASTPNASIPLIGSGC